MSFEEATYSSLFTEPLDCAGLLRFTPPSTLEKEVLEPYRERYVIEGDRVTFESERKHMKKDYFLGRLSGLAQFGRSLPGQLHGRCGDS